MKTNVVDYFIIRIDFISLNESESKLTKLANFPKHKNLFYSK